MGREMKIGLDLCNKALEGMPRLSVVFDPAWRANLHNLAIAGDVIGAVTYFRPTGFDSWPHYRNIFYHVETALDVIWDKLDSQSRFELFARMRRVCLTEVSIDSDLAASQSAEEELLAVYGFAEEFGRDSIRLPPAGPGTRPEFTVDINGVHIPVECKGRGDEKAVRDLDKGASRAAHHLDNLLDDQSLTDEEKLSAVERLAPDCCWCENIGPQGHLLKKAIRDKLRRCQAGRPSVLIVVLHTPWIYPEEQEDIVRRVFSDPKSFGIRAEDVPPALAVVACGFLQGVWVDDASLAAAGVDGYGERIRSAIRCAFPARANDGKLRTESGIRERDCSLKRD